MTITTLETRDSLTNKTGQSQCPCGNYITVDKRDKGANMICGVVRGSKEKRGAEETAGVTEGHSTLCVEHVFHQTSR